MRITKNILTITLLLFISNLGHAQESDASLVKHERLAIGLGIGPQTAIFGLKTIYYPSPSIGLFVGLGGAEEKLGLAGGIRIRGLKFELVKNLTPFVYACYGHNTIYDDELLYGLSYGLGLDYHIETLRSNISAGFGRRNFERRFMLFYQPRFQANICWSVVIAANTKRKSVQENKN